MTAIIAPPAVIMPPTFPDLGNPSYNALAYAWGTAQPNVSFRLGEIAAATYQNATAAQERAVAAAASADASAISAAAAALDADMLASLYPLWLGAAASDPTTGRDGAPLVAGNAYINTVSKALRAYDGTEWGQAVGAVAGVSSLNGAVGDLVRTTLAAYGITDAMPASGGTFTGPVSTKENTGAVTGVAGGTLQVMGGTSSAAFMSFHRSGAYAINFGLDVDGVVRMGGWSQGSGVARFAIDASGNYTATGNVSAYSDERLKKDWAPVAVDFVHQLAQLMHGTYTRIDTGERQAGVSAQKLRKFLPEAVAEDAQGTLSVAYGNASLVACVQLARCVVALEKRIQTLESSQ